MKPAIAVWSEEERAARTRFEIDKAFMHLSEAETLAAAGGTPNACVHSAYYSMYHCAAAVLLATGGVGPSKGLPKNHTIIAEEFAKRIASEPGELGESGRMLSEILAERVVADYAVDRDSTADAAEHAAKSARRFVGLCSARWGFAPTR